MKNSLVLSSFCLVLLAGFTGSCSRKVMKQNNAAPDCINSKIAELSKGGWGCETGESIKQYTFQNKTVYVLEPGTCGNDMAVYVLDANCKDMGFLGGIMGNTKINGEEFANAVYVKTVWSN
ncbi:MAG: hypothetical protein V4561_07795 [Bacteroidota bacterium]